MDIHARRLSGQCNSHNMEFTDLDYYDLSRHIKREIKYLKICQK